MLSTRALLRDDVTCSVLLKSHVPASCFDVFLVDRHLYIFTQFFKVQKEWHDGLNVVVRSALRSSLESSFDLPYLRSVVEQLLELLLGQCF